MAQENNSQATVVAAFDRHYKLVAIFGSVSEAANMTGALRQSLIKAIYGDIISVKGKYWRAIPTDIEMEPDDIGKLSLLEFDALTGQDRKIYGSRKMTKSSAMYESQYFAEVERKTIK